MADVGSLGEYKVVVTADYSQLKTQFDAMSNFVISTTKVMSDNLNKTMGGINATMISQLKTTVDQLKKSFEVLILPLKKVVTDSKPIRNRLEKLKKPPKSVIKKSVRSKGKWLIVPLCQMQT